MDENTYYITQKNKMLQGLASYAKPMRPELAVRFGEEEAREIMQDVLDEYAYLIPQFPYIGGRRNPFTTNLIQAGYGLALYRTLHKHGRDTHEGTHTKYCAARLNHAAAHGVRTLVMRARYDNRLR